MPENEKKKKKNAHTPQRIINPVEWLKQDRRTNDQNILKMLITGYATLKLPGENLNKALFEKTFKLNPLPLEPTTLKILNEVLNYRKGEQTVEPTTLEKINRLLLSDKVRHATTFREQVESLLPRMMSIQEDIEKETEDERNIDRRKKERESLTYALSRIVVDKVPTLTDLSIESPGLDGLSAAILTLYSISQVVSHQVPWLFNIWDLEIRKAKVKALKLILDSLSSESIDDIETALGEAETNINDVLAQEAGIDAILSKDPIVTKIDEWRKVVLNKMKSFIDRKDELRKAVSREISIIKGFSAPLEAEIDVQEGALTHWPILAIRADGPLAYSHESLLRNIRNEINILHYPPLFGLCSILSESEDPNRPTANDLEQVSDLEGRTAFYVIKELEPLLVEQYLPSFKKMGLRYRYIFTPRQRPAHLSDGLIERMIFTERNIRGCTVHLEPNWSKGPNIRSYEKGTYEAIVEEETISLNLDCFDKQLGEWSFNPPESSSKNRKKSKGLITRTTLTSNNDPVVLTERQIELLSLLWSIPMSRSQRKWFLERVEYPQRTANRMLRQMLLEETMRLVYLPTLELIGLSDGFIAVAHCYDRRSRNNLVDSMQNILPFARIMTGDSNDVVAQARVPSKKSDIVGGILSEIMVDLSSQSFIARQRQIKHYRMTALNKIRDLKSRKWKDPWNLSI